jgi:Phosphodiester glycosidase
MSAQSPYRPDLRPETRRLLPAGVRRSPRRGRLRAARRVIGALLLVGLLFVGVSYTRAMLRPSNAPLGVRSVEWLRDNGMAWLVNDVERFWYSLHAPAKGGPALKSLPVAGVAPSSLPALRRRSATAHVPRRVAVPYRPHRIAPLVHPALPGEGVWRRTTAGHGPAPILVTTLRAEPDYPRLVTGVAWIDTHRTRLVLYPGRYEPPSGAPRGPMEVPGALRRHLLATFNSGFKLQDAHGGFVAGGHVYAPLAKGEATLVVSRSGRVDVRAWTGAAYPTDVLLARQNLPLIVDHGRPNPNLADGPAWGATLGNAIRVWRSAIGIDRHGDLLYAAANEQTVASLAHTLIHAGAVRAMELDINSFWVSFITYDAPGAGGPSNLLPDMNRATTRYLSPDDRDFFAVYRRSRG